MPESIFNLRIFQWIERSVVENIILMCEEREFESGHIILTEWAETNGEGYIIHTGSVSVLIGWNHIVDLGEGDMFWEIALLPYLMLAMDWWCIVWWGSLAPVLLVDKVLTIWRSIFMLM